MEAVDDKFWVNVFPSAQGRSFPSDSSPHDGLNTVCENTGAVSFAVSNAFILLRLVYIGLGLFIGVEFPSLAVGQ